MRGFAIAALVSVCLLALLAHAVASAAPAAPTVRPSSQPSEKTLVSAWPEGDQ